MHIHRMVKGLRTWLTLTYGMWGAVAYAAPPEASPLAEVSPGACTPEVRLGGDEALIAEVSRHLHLAGISTTGERRCVTVVIDLQRDAQGAIQLRIADTQGRTTGRRVSGAATAATVIESWARVDLVEPMLDADMTAPPALAASSLSRDEAVSPLEPPAATAAPGPTSAASPSFAAGMWFGASAANDGSVWADVGLSACIDLKPLCVGAELRGTADLDELGAAAKLGTDRGGLDGLLTAHFIGALGPQPWQVSPGFGVGFGYIASDVDTDDASEASRSDLTLRVATMARVGFQVSKGFHLAGRLGFEVAPTARTRHDRTAEGVLIAGVPRWYVRFALSVHYGAF